MNNSDRAHRPRRGESKLGTPPHAAGRGLLPRNFVQNLEKGMPIPEDVNLDMEDMSEDDNDESIMDAYPRRRQSRYG